jgi:hypothetical protein
MMPPNTSPSSRSRASALAAVAGRRSGSVALAARAVGMSPRSAYLLLDAPGADSFAAAWDRAIDEGVERVRADALQRALGGVFVPVYRRGRLVRVEHRQSDALAIALLGGGAKDIEDYRRTAVSRRRYRQDMAELDRQREEEQRRKDQVWAEHQAILDSLEFDRLLTRPPTAHPSALTSQIWSPPP